MLIGVLASAAAEATLQDGPGSTIVTLRHSLGDRCPPILVGGEPFVIVPDLWTIVGADGCAADAGAAVAVGERLVHAR